jgi:hypothetical protein
MIDDVTRAVYEVEPSLGDFGGASYHERIAKRSALMRNAYKAPLVDSGMPEGDVRLVRENHSKAITQAGYVLGAFRRNYADVHGVTSAPRELVQHALDAAVFVLRGFVGLRQ